MGLWQNSKKNQTMGNIKI